MPRLGRQSYAPKRGYYVYNRDSVLAKIIGDIKLDEPLPQIE